MSESGKPVDLDKGRPLAKTAKSGWGVIFSTLFGGLFLILCVACGIGLYSFRPVIDASPDDPDLDDSGLVGAPLVARMLGGTVIDEVDED